MVCCERDLGFWTPLTLVAGVQDVVKMLVDAAAGVSEQDQDGLTALMNAAEIGAGEIVTFMLNKG